jgi:WD40 repeat protein
MKGDHVISCGRDMSAKLTELATERFVDNLTSITPGALKGGLAAIARHPLRDEILVGGADGVPQIYRVFREVQRRIGDNSNLIRKYPAMEGRIWAVDYSADGKRVLAASSLDGKGTLMVGRAEFDSALPDQIKGIYGKESTGRSAEENKAVEAWQTGGAEVLKQVTVDGGLYAARFSPDGKTIAAAGQSGKVMVLRSEDLGVIREFVPVPITAAGSGEGR